MTSSKALFLRKSPDGTQSLASWWASIVHDDRFQLVMACARAETMESRPSQEQIIGAEIMLQTLQTLSDNEPDLSEYPSPGLQHSFTKPITETTEGTTYGNSNT